MMRTPEEERIFHALSQMKTPACDLSGVVEQAGSHRRARLRPGRPLAVAAVLCALLTIGAAAVGISGAWRYFAPSLPQNAVETVGVSQTAGDYTLTVVDAVADDSNIMLLLALSRADGGKIDPEASLNTNSMDLMVKVDGSYSGRCTSYQLSPDGKTIYICYEYMGAPNDGSILGKPITLSAEGVAVKLWDEDGYSYIRGDAPVSLAPLAERATPDFSDSGWTIQEMAQAAATQGAEIPLPMAETFPLFIIQGAAMTTDGLSVAVSGKSCASGELVCSLVFCDSLVDTRTGTRYEGGSHGTYLEEDGTRITLWSFRDCPLTPEDLPYLEVEVSYAIDRILSDKPFSLIFTLDDTSGLLLTLDGELVLDGLTLHPVELRLSPLELRLSFADDAETAFSLCEDGTAPVLHLTDGAEIATRWQGGRDLGDSAPPTVSFRVEDTDGERLFIDPGQVVSITFGNLEIPVEH